MSSHGAGDPAEAAAEIAASGAVSELTRKAAAGTECPVCLDTEHEVVRFYRQSNLESFYCCMLFVCVAARRSGLNTIEPCSFIQGLHQAAPLVMPPQLAVAATDPASPASGRVSRPALPAISTSVIWRFMLGHARRCSHADMGAAVPVWASSLHVRCAAASFSRCLLQTS